MQNHTKVYFNFFGYDESSYIECEMQCGSRAVDIHHLDNGGMVEHFKFMIRSLERIGVSAVIIEDKIGIKRNSI